MKNVINFVKLTIIGGAIAFCAIIAMNGIIELACKPYVYPSSQKLESQGFYRLPNETPEEHEKRGQIVCDTYRL